VINGIQQAIRAGLLRAFHRPDLVRDRQTHLGVRRQFAEAIHKQYPGKLLAYNCSPSFNWKKNLTMHRSPGSSANWVRWLQFQFITLAGFHSLNYSMFELARGYAPRT